jgi:dihydrofolate reductase
MARIVVINHLTLDGVMQGPGRADEDVRDGFAHGGWAAPGGDEVMAAAMGAAMAGVGPLLLGRRTYEDFYGYWPRQQDNPYTESLNKRRKYVASTTLTEPLPWQNSTLLSGDAVAAVAGLKRAAGSDIAIFGSGRLIRSLLPHDLIDEYLLMTYPLVLGTGRRMFPGDGPRLGLRLVDSVTTTTGVVIATYRPETAS